MYIFLFAAFVCAALEALAVQRGQRRLEFIVKPAVMIALFLWLWTSVGLQGAALWFGLGLLFSLAGDVLLMFPGDQFFLAGLVTFLLAHVAYVIGLNSPPPAFSVWSLILAAIVGLSGARLLRRIVAPLARQGQSHLRTPVLLYGAVISLMLLSAMLKLTDLRWNALAALLVALGAGLFYASDLILAWMKFVAPIRNGPIYNIVSYHLGQIALIAGVVIHLMSS